jgi:hypothetical protein
MSTELVQTPTRKLVVLLSRVEMYIINYQLMVAARFQFPVASFIYLTGRIVTLRLEGTGQLTLGGTHQVQLAGPRTGHTATHDVVTAQHPDHERLSWRYKLRRLTSTRTAMISRLFTTRPCTARLQVTRAAVYVVCRPQ